MPAELLPTFTIHTWKILCLCEERVKDICVLSLLKTLTWPKTVPPSRLNYFSNTTKLQVSISIYECLGWETQTFGPSQGRKVDSIKHSGVEIFQIPLKTPFKADSLKNALSCLIILWHSMVTSQISNLLIECWGFYSEINSCSPVGKRERSTCLWSQTAIPRALRMKSKDKGFRCHFKQGKLIAPVEMKTLCSKGNRCKTLFSISSHLWRPRVWQQTEALRTYPQRQMPDSPLMRNAWPHGLRLEAGDGQREWGKLHGIFMFGNECLHTCSVCTPRWVYWTL